MKKNYLLAGLIVLLCTAKSFAQTYSSFGVGTTSGTAYEDITIEQDTLSFQFSGLQPGAIGTPKFVVYFEGDFSAPSEYTTAYLPGFVSIGNTHQTINDCDPEDSTEMFVSAAQLASLGSSFTLNVVTTIEVNTFCTVNRVKVHLVYDYCTFGTPVSYASLTIPDNLVCPLDGPQTLVGTPANGTFSGPGVTGSSFNPVNLASGTYNVSYTATDAIGCITTDTKQITIKSAPSAIIETVCQNTSPSVNLGAVNDYIFSLNPLLTSNNLDTTTQYTFPSVTQSPVTYYYGSFVPNSYDTANTIVLNNSYVVDHDMLTGDDRSGIAITDSTIYIVGDNNTVRFDLNLQNGVSLPRMDGLVTDLSQNKIYSLYNTVSGQTVDANMGYTQTVDALIELNADLTVGGTIIPFSQSLILDGNSNDVGIYNGFGHVIFQDGNDNFYNVAIPSGTVTSLGTHFIYPYSSENWATWGITKVIGTDTVVYYRDDITGLIKAYDLNTMTSRTVSEISDFSDMACFIVHPSNNRFYFHYEGGTATFGGMSETAGYTDYNDALFFGPSDITGCSNQITYTFNTIDLGPDTTVCDGDGAFILEAGFGYNSYTWNGVNNNWNIYPVQDSGQYVVEAIDEVNCVITDTINVFVDNCSSASLYEEQMISMNIHPVPNNGKFTINFNTSLVDANVEIIDMTGKTVYQQRDNSGNESMVVSTNLKTGVYLVRVTSQNRVSQQSIVIE